MEFNVNHPILFVFVGIIIAAVLGQSIYFLLKSVKRAKTINMNSALVKKTIITAAIFTIAPAIAIVITVISLSQSLGIALPWLRLPSLARFPTRLSPQPMLPAVWILLLPLLQETSMHRSILP